MEWNKDNTILLIEYFKEKRELWDSTSADFTDRNKKHDAWKDLADKLKTDKSVVKKEMRSLIGQFQRELKKPKSGPGAEELNSKWFGFELLLFLKPKKKVRSANEAGISKDEGDHEKEKETGNENKANTFGAPRLKTHRKRTLPEEGESSEALSILKKMYGSGQTRDEFDVFGEHVAMKLRNLDSSYAKHTAQFQINNILYHAAIGEYNWPPFNSPHNVPPDNSGFHTPGRSGPSEASATPGHSSVISVDYSSHSLDDMITSEDMKPDVKDLS